MDQLLNVLGTNAKAHSTTEGHELLNRLVWDKPYIWAIPSHPTPSAQSICGKTTTSLQNLHNNI